MTLLLALVLLVLPLPLAAQAGGAGEVGASGMVAVPGGAFVPQYAARGDSTRVEPFRLDATPVTVGQFLAFVRETPEWRRSRARTVFAGHDYLASWDGDLDPGEDPELRTRPVTGVTWFAARAYCRWRGARLPTTDEWELAAGAGATEPDAFRDRDFNRTLMALHAARQGREVPPPVGQTFRNAYGIWDLHGVVWEWVSDFNNQMATGAARDDRGLDRGLFCAAGSVDATDRADYAAFLRYAFRSSLTGTYAGPGLGFRCAN